MNITKTFTYLLISLCFLISQAQQTPNALEKTISLKISNMPADEFLKLLGKEAKINFSYNPAILNPNKKINLNLKNKSVRYVLNVVFENQINYKSKGNYVILNKKTPLTESQKTKFYQITGYILDGYSTAGISNASVYEPSSLRSTITDKDGFFTLNMPYNLQNIQLIIQKKGYRDSSITMVSYNKQSLEVFLEADKPLNLTFNIPKDTLVSSDSSVITSVLISENDTLNQDYSSKVNTSWLVLNSKLKVHLQNISDTIFRKTQISILPLISTNRLISGNVVNNYSLNLLGGYNFGVKKLELGGLFNINIGNVGKCQMAGLANLVGGKVSGYQAAGLVNVVRDTVKACQMAGLINFNFKQTRGCQFAGLANHTKSLKGTQFAGLYNATFHTNGGQFAGLFNTSLKIKGIQVAGLFNTAWDVQGSQISGLFNFARKVTGVQIGFLNIADSCLGTPIGFLSLVRNGYHKIEFSADDIFKTNLGFRTGTRKFYNIFGVGSTLQSGNKFAWSYSYGIGTSFKLHHKLYLDLDLLSSQINADKHANYLSLNNKLNIGLDWQFAPKFSLAFGPSFNTYVVDNRLYSENSLYQNIGKDYPSIKYPTHSNIDVRSWIGWKVALRIL
ncbi:MAG: STN and carboxypeptidase regulatory-like domain-containing protein [Cytophagales bacterium]